MYFNLYCLDKNHFIVVRIRSQNSCFGVNIKNCDMEVDSIFKSNQYSIPKILKVTINKNFNINYCKIKQIN